MGAMWRCPDDIKVAWGGKPRVPASWTVVLPLRSAIAVNTVSKGTSGQMISSRAEERPGSIVNFTGAKTGSDSVADDFGNPCGKLTVGYP